MSVQMRIIPPSDADQGFGLLKDIVDMVKNPKAIDEAYERRRKAAALSEKEIEQSELARSFIASADALKKELQEREGHIAAAEKEHEKNMAAHVQRVESESTRLAEWENRLNSIAANQEQVDKNYSDIRKVLDARTAEIEKSHADWQKRYDERVAAIVQKEQSQKEEDTRLAEVGKRLRDKAAKLADLAQSDG